MRTMEAPRMADGSLSKEHILIARMPICCQNKIANVDVMIQPNRTSGHFLVGYIFMKTTGMIIDTANDDWYFAPSPRRRNTMNLRRRNPEHVYRSGIRDERLIPREYR